MNPDALERLLNEMARPIRVWRFAVGLLRNVYLKPGAYTGAETRRINALTEIDQMMREYVRAHPDG